jgi:hypothetical protein
VESADPSDLTQHWLNPLFNLAHPVPAILALPSATSTEPTASAMEYMSSSPSTTSTIHAFTGVGGFAYLKFKNSKQQQLAQLLIARNDALPPSSLHKLFHLYVQGIPPDSSAGRWAREHKHYLNEALLCALRNTAVHTPAKLPKVMMALHPDDVSTATVNLHDMFVQFRTAYYLANPRSRPITTIFREDPDDEDLVIPVQGRQPAGIQAGVDDPRSRGGLLNPACLVPQGFLPAVILPATPCVNTNTRAAVEKYINDAHQHSDIPSFDELFWVAADAAFCKATPEEQSAYLRCYPDSKDGHDPSTWAEKLRVFWKLTGNADDVHAKSALCQRYVEGLDIIKPGLTAMLSAKRMDLSDTDRNDLDTLQQLAQRCFDAMLQRTSYYLHNPAPPGRNRVAAAADSGSARGLPARTVGPSAQKYCSLHGMGGHSTAECSQLRAQRTNASSSYATRNVYPNTSPAIKREENDRTVRFASPPPQARSNSQGPVSARPADRPPYRAAVTHESRAKPVCRVCGNEGHLEERCFVTNPRDALKLYPEYSGPKDPQLHQIYVEACRRQGLIPRTYQPRAKTAVHVMHDNLGDWPAHCEPHCPSLAYEDWFDGCSGVEQAAMEESSNFSRDITDAAGGDVPGERMALVEDAMDEGGDDRGGDQFHAVHVTSNAAESSCGDNFCCDTNCQPAFDVPANLIANVMTRAQLRLAHEAVAQHEDGEVDADDAAMPPAAGQAHDGDDASVAADHSMEVPDGSVSLPHASTPTVPDSNDDDGTPPYSEAFSVPVVAPLAENAAGGEPDVEGPADVPAVPNHPAASGPRPSAPGGPVSFTAAPPGEATAYVPPQSRNPGRIPNPPLPRANRAATLMNPNPPTPSQPMQYWVTIAQLLRVADHPHILRFLRHNRYAYQSVQSASTQARGAAPVSVVEWQDHSIPVGPEIYNLCLHPVPAVRPFVRTAPTRMPASISIHIDPATATPRMYQLLRDLATLLENPAPDAALRPDPNAPAAHATQFVSSGFMKAAGVASAYSTLFQAIEPAIPKKTPVSSLLRTQPVEELVGMTGWNLHEKLRQSKAAVFTLPRASPDLGFSMMCRHSGGGVTHISPDVVLTDSGANCNVCTQAFLRKHQLKYMAYEGALDTSAGGTSAQIVGYIPQLKMVLKHGSEDELMVCQNMYVIAGSNPLFEVIVGTPALLAMGAFTDPLLATFFYRPRWQSAADLQHIVGIPARVALVCSKHRSKAPHITNCVHIPAWRGATPAALVTSFPTSLHLPGLIDGAAEQHPVPASDDDGQSECSHRGSSLSNCSDGCVHAATAPSGDTDLLFCHEILQASYRPCMAPSATLQPSFNTARVPPSPSIVRDLFGAGGPLHSPAEPNTPFYAPSLHASAGYGRSSSPNSHDARGSARDIDHGGQELGSQGTDSSSQQSHSIQSAQAQTTWNGSSSSLPVLLAAVLMVIHMLWVLCLSALTFGFALWMARKVEG